QAKLLRFIQTETFQKVGGSDVEQVDVRFVCATNRDPYREVQNGNFREDLYYRLHVIPIDLPPLRDRGDDILDIARDFLTRYAAEEGKSFTGFTEAAEDILLAFDWPGNVRELQNVLRQIVVLNDGDMVEPDMMPPPLNENSPAPETMRPAGAKPAAAAPGADGQADTAGAPAATQRPVAADGAIRPMADIEREAIEHAIEQCGGNVRKAASLLGISAPTIYRKKAVWDEEIGA
ncbi:MAG: sigma 54-interacting transcriptional regulator, partial [Alphaproteobacteria bacterium]